MSRNRTGGRTYREVAEQEYGLLMCAGPGCRRKYGRATHLRGKVDTMNVIHFERADVVPRTSGLRKFLILCARAVNDREYRGKPTWERLYLENTWASREAQRRFRYRVKATESFGDRRRALSTASRKGVSLRPNFLMYLWARKPLTYTETSTSEAQERTA